MKFAKQLKGMILALLILIICFPISVILTLLTSSFWLWYERTFAVEAYGHSGPAEWCYLVAYGVTISLCTCIWALLRKKN